MNPGVNETRSPPTLPQRDRDGTRPTHFVVDAAFQVPHGGPALLLLHLGVVMQDFVPQPGQVVNAQFVLLTCRINVASKLQNKHEFGELGELRAWMFIPPSVCADGPSGWR